MKFLKLMLKITVAIVVLLLVASWLMEASKTPEQRAEEKRKGLHCLSAGGGGNTTSHPEFISIIKEKLRDPGSFEHIETGVSPVDEAGNHTIRMRYRAKNGFGGMNVDEAHGAYRNSDCKMLFY